MWIYLIDENSSETSHAKYIHDVIQKNTNVDIKIIHISKNPSIKEITKVINNLIETVSKNDIVLCCLVTAANQNIDDLFNKLANKCKVIVPAGNIGKDISFCSPARATDVITVGCLNKSGVKATLSNHSNSKPLVWVPGTNYSVGWKNSSGTCVSAAIYTAFLAEALQHDDLTILENLLTKHKQAVSRELQSS